MTTAIDTRARLLLAAAALMICALTAGSAPPAAGAAALDSDPHLAGWWRFDETTGQRAEDASSHQRHGTCQESLSFDTHAVPGRVGGAVKLDGSSGIIVVGGWKGVTGASARTVAAWVKTGAARGEIVSWGHEDFGKMWTFGFVRGRIGISPKGGYLYMQREAHDDAWHHVAAVMHEADPPNLHDHVTLYLDGEPAVIHDIGLLDLWPIDTGANMDVRIGRGFKGELDDLRIYDRALSEEEIALLFQHAPQPDPKP